MGRPAMGVVAAALAVVTGGLAGGAVAFAVFALPAATSSPPVAQAVPDAVAIERTMPLLEIETASATVPASADDSHGVETTPEPEAAAGPAGEPAAPAPVPVASCPSAIGGSTPGAPGVTSAGGVAGTSTADLDAFAAAYNATRVANCLQPVPPANIRYDACMEQRLFWMAEDPSSDPMSAWGHIGSVRSDGVPSVGCDGNLAGGYNNVASTFARKWWDSSGHLLSLYVPDYTGSTASVCVYFAVTHGGVPDEPAAFTRAAARWGSC